MKKNKNSLKKIESRGEEIANFVSHTAGAGLAILRIYHTYYKGIVVQQCFCTNILHNI